MTKESEKAKPKKIRVTLDLVPGDYNLLCNFSEMGKDHANTLRKALRVLNDLKEERCFLTTQEGSRIPISIIFS
jgi:hypothetical protein